MKKTSKAIEVSNALSSRYGLELLNDEDWEELELFGGMGMDPPTFDALANAAKVHGDTQATIYELESTKVEFAPVPIHLDFPSFNRLKGNAISHFEVALVPPSKKWAALLTDELETFVLGPPKFLSDIASNIPAKRESD